MAATIRSGSSGPAPGVQSNCNKHQQLRTTEWSIVEVTGIYSTNRNFIIIFFTYSVLMCGPAMRAMMRTPETPGGVKDSQVNLGCPRCSTYKVEENKGASLRNNGDKDSEIARTKMTFLGKFVI